MLVCMIFLLISIAFDIFQKISKKFLSVNFFLFFIATRPVFRVYCLYETKQTCKKTGADHLV